MIAVGFVIFHILKNAELRWREKRDLDATSPGLGRPEFGITDAKMSGSDMPPPQLGLVNEALDQAEANAIYEAIAKEMDKEQLQKALWTRALAEGDGDMAKSQARYIKLRFNELLAERRNQVVAGQLRSQALEAEERAERRQQLMGVAKTEERLQRWDRGIVFASKFLTNPVPADIYCQRYGVSRDQLRDWLGRGKLKGYEHQNELYVEDQKLEAP